MTRQLTGPLAGLITSLLLACPLAAADQDAAGETAATDRIHVAPGVYSTGDGSKVTYDASYFTPYQVVTAADMLRWVPGGAALLPGGPGGGNDDKRGFGSGGDQVLINGKRLSGKSNDIGSAMQRIQADVVRRIELIRGTAAGLDVRSEGTLINIVLSEDIAAGSGSWQLHSAFYGRSKPDFDGLFSYSDAAGKLDYLLSAELGPYNRGNDVERYEEFFAPDTGALTERREIVLPMLKKELVLNASGSWAFDDGAILNVNTRFADTGNEEDETTRAISTGEPDAALFRNILDQTGKNWEIGGDAEQPVGAGSLKTRAIFQRRNGDEARRITLSSTDAGNVPAESLFTTRDVATESILRSSYSWQPAAGHNLELGVEAARNTLDKDIRLFEVAPDGGLTPVTLFNSDSDVTEDRYELFSTYFWPMRPSIVLESALNIEYSEIGQQGVDVDNARSFTYVKPRIDLRWDLTGATQLRSSLERTVSQLDFGDFVANFDNDNDQVDTGNPELEPQKAWEFTFAWERRLADDNGVLQARVFYNDVEDHIDNVRVTDTVSAAGNIGDARYYGAVFSGSWRLSSIGLEGAVLDASYTLQDSSTTDPFTGSERKMSGIREREYSLNFRHDIAAWRFNYNIEVDWRGKRYANDINFREIQTAVRPNTHIAMQYRLTDRVLLWFDTRIVFDSHDRRTRERYTGNIADGNLLRREVRDHHYRREHIIGLRGQF